MENQDKGGNFKTFLRNKENLGLVISNAVLFLVGIIFTLILIVSATRPVTLGKEYKYEFGDLGDSYYMCTIVTFTEDECCSEVFAGTESMEATQRYKINKGNVYVKDDRDDWEMIGKVSPYEMKITLSGFTLTLECVSAKALKVVSIVFLCVGFAGGAVLTAINCLNYKKSGTIVLETENNQ